MRKYTTILGTILECRTSYLLAETLKLHPLRRRLESVGYIVVLVFIALF